MTTAQNCFVANLPPEHQEMYALIHPLPDAAYTMDSAIASIEKTLATIERDCTDAPTGCFELEPDFQRGHVWTQDQQIAYVEAIFRKTAPNRIMFNCPGWTRESTTAGDINDNEFQCIDGLQRLTACRKFMAGEFTLFGKYKAQDLKGTPFDPRRFTLQFCIYEFNSRADLLNHYLRINSGGSVHTPEELDRVRALLALAA